MATITSVGSGLWSAAGTWDAGVPADDDIVVIASGHIVEFNVDQSAFANGINGITITGTLSLTRTAGTYQLKMKAAAQIAGAGTFDCGTSVSPIPFAAKHTITGGSLWYINGASGLTMTVYAVEPTINFVQLTDGEAASATVLRVNKDVTADIWAAGDTIHIVNSAAGLRNIEVRTIASITSSTITITSGLSGAKSVGSAVGLINRNVQFENSGSTALLQGFNGGLTIAGGGFTCPANRIIASNCNNYTISGGCFHTSSSQLVQGGSNVVISGGLYSNAGFQAITVAGSPPALVSNVVVLGTAQGIGCAGGTVQDSILIGNTYPLGDSTRFMSVSNCTILGFRSTSITGNDLLVIDSSVTNGNFGFETSSFLIKNTVITNSNISHESRFTAFNVAFGGGGLTRKDFLSTLSYSESLDHDQVPGAFQAWTAGGVTSSVGSGVVPMPSADYNLVYRIALDSATRPGYWQREYLVASGQSVNFDIWFRKDAAMSYLPRAYFFFKSAVDPLAGGTPEHTFTMTNSIDTWENEPHTYTNDTPDDVVLIARFIGYNASGNIYTALGVKILNVDLTETLARLAAIKTKTDQFVFTVANQVDANALTGGGGATPQQVWEYVTRTLTGEVTLQDGAITAAKIATDAITAAKIAANAITAAKIATDAITAAKIAANAITAAKIANDAITDAKIATFAITAPKIATNAITDSKIATSAIDKIQATLALEATLSAIKGPGWTTETLEEIMAAVLIGGIDPASIRSAIGMASPNIDDQFTALTAYMVGLQTWLATEVEASITEGLVTQIRGNSWLIEIEELTLDPHLIQFAIKCPPLKANLNQCATPARFSHPDSDAVILIDTDTGLLRINGSPADSSLGSLSYAADTLTITLSAAATAQLSPGTYSFGIQSIDPHGIVSEVYGGHFIIIPDVIRSVS